MFGGWAVGGTRNRVAGNKVQQERLTVTATTIRGKIIRCRIFVSVLKEVEPIAGIFGLFQIFSAGMSAEYVEP